MKSNWWKKIFPLFLSLLFTFLWHLTLCIIIIKRNYILLVLYWQGDANYLRYRGMQEFDQAMQHLEERYTVSSNWNKFPICIINVKSNWVYLNVMDFIIFIYLVKNILFNFKYLLLYFMSCMKPDNLLDRKSVV